MLKRIFDGVMERRARKLVEQVGAFLPQKGEILDLGSGTGHVADLIIRDFGIEVIPADFGDLHVVGPPPVPINEGALPFPEQSFTAALLFFMLAYPKEPARLLAEAARVTRGPLILVQTVYSGGFGYAWHRQREFIWTVVAFHVSRAVGYIPRSTPFTMQTRRFYTEEALQAEVTKAGLEITARSERAVLPRRALVVVAWKLEPND